MNHQHSERVPDDLFATVDPADFGAMIDVDRYGTRAVSFDRFIAETQMHFWDPADPAYLAFDVPFDMDGETVLPLDMVPELQSAVADRLTERERIRFANESARWLLSSLLHGEQAGLSLSNSLCQLLRNPGAVEYAANQAREEARHVTAFSRYISVRWGKPYPASRGFSTLLAQLVSDTELYRKIVGLQLIVEGLALGIFSMLHRRCRDPLLKRLTQLVMVDEALHHEAGKMWTRYALPDLTAEQRDAVEDWAASCFQVLVANLHHPKQKQIFYEPFGLDWEWVRDAMREALADKDRRKEYSESNGIFRILIKTLLDAGLITKRTRHYYAVWADLKGIAENAEDFANDSAVRNGIDFLTQINSSRAIRKRT